MKEKSLYQFNIALTIIAIMSAASSVLLECLQGNTFLNMGFHEWVWIHIIVCLLCMLAVIYHLYLHKDSIRQWLGRVGTISAKWLAWSWLLTFLSGIIAFILFCTKSEHNPIGGIHGKIGLLAVGFMFFHFKKRLRWFKGGKKERSFYPIIDQEKCIGCGKCIKGCPAQVFTRNEEQVIAQNTQFCHQCMKCASHCPRKAIYSNNPNYH